MALVAFHSGLAFADTEVQALAIATGVVVATAFLTPPSQESNALSFELGQFDAIKKIDRATSFGAEFRSGDLLLWRLRPFAGAAFTTDQSLFGYAGLRFSAYWTDKLIVTPSFAIGGYSRGHGKDLGTAAVIGRFGIDVEYVLSNEIRIGLSYHHISNGKVLGQDINPGTEVVGMTVATPLK